MRKFIVQFLISFMLFVPMLSSVGFTQSQPAILKAKVSKLTSFLDKYEMEKAYLQFDKPYYAAGDTIYFKAYVVTGEKNLLSPLSGVLYVNLIDPKNKIIRSIKLPLTGGLSHGDFALNDSIKGGSYRISAYTKLMQSNDAELIFIKRIDIISKDKFGTATLSDKLSRIDKVNLQFFPEGGDLVAGIESKIAFKAITQNGTGISLKGEVLDSHNKLLTSFSSTRLGMGVLTLKPVEGESYRAAIVYANGFRDTTKLPVCKLNGVVMSVSDSTRKISIHINPNKTFYNKFKDDPFGVFIYSAGKLITINSQFDGEDLRFDIEKKGLRSGINQITLFSSEGEPICERLVFINNNDQLHVKIEKDSLTYSPRSKTKLNIHVQDQFGNPVSGHFSISVVDKGKVSSNENRDANIFTYLLLTSQLKGYIEDPGYYFNNKSAKKQSDLDLVMLTHGYRRFTWKGIENLSQEKIEPEKGLSITGTASTSKGKLLENEQVTLIPSQGGRLVFAATNKQGVFKFENLIFYDSTKFVLNVGNPKRSKDVQLRFIPEPSSDALKSQPFYTLFDTTQSTEMEVYLQNTDKRDRDNFKDGHQMGKMLQEVKVNALVKDKFHSMAISGTGGADNVILGKELDHSSLLAIGLSTKVGGLYFDGTFAPGGGVPKLQISNGNKMLVVVDGTERPIGSGINDILPNDVERVEVLKYASTASYGIQGGAGVLIITTKQGRGRELGDIRSFGVLPITATGFYKSRDFYSPKYGTSKSLAYPDFRSTIFWIPELTINAQGEGNFEYFNTDQKGKVEVKLEGLGENGKTGQSIFTYQVK